MKIRILLLSLSCALLAAPTMRAADDKDSTVLGDHMDNMNKAMRALKKQVADAAQNKSSLELVATIKKEAAEAAKEKPAWTADKPAADQAKYVEDFKGGMKDLNDKLVALETALKANQNDVAAKIVEEIGQAQKKGHKQFKKPETKK